MAKTFKAIIKETGEEITLYKLQNGNYYDYDNMGASHPPASRTGKKEFDPNEVKILKENNV